MKKIYKSVAFGSLALAMALNISSCSDFLDVQLQVLYRKTRFFLI